MRWAIAAVIGLHGLIHLMGFAKAFGYAELPQLTQPITRPWGTAWLAAAVLVVLSAAMFGAGSRAFWMVGALALVVSQAIILSAWRDAWAGTIANLLLVLLVGHGWLTEGPRSYHAQYVRDAAEGLSRPFESRVVAEADLAPLPEPVQRYLRYAGVVGRPRVRDYHLHFRGLIRGAPDARWMPFEAEQHSFADTPARLFLMRARMFGLPVEAFHRFIDGHATMQVTAVGAVPIVDARGEVMDRSETVTLFNDMCVLAPATLVDAAIRWEPVDAHTAKAYFTNRGQTISATLLFGDDGALMDFASDDRSRSSPDGTTFTPARFTTPLRDYRDFGPARLAAHGEARWTLPDGAFTYGEFELIDIAYNAKR